MNYLLYAGRSLNAFADYLLMFLIPLVVFQSTGRAELSGFAFAIEYLPKVLLGPVSGLLTDRLPLAPLVRVSALARGIACVVAGIALIWLPPFYVMLALGFTVGCFFSLDFMAFETMLTQVVAKEKFAQVQARVQSQEQTALITAPIIGALLISQIDAQGVLWVAAGVFLLALMSLYLGCRDKVFSPPPDAHLPLISLLKTNLLTGQHYLRKNPSLQRLVLATFLVNLIFATTLAIGAAVMTGHFGGTEKQFALLQTVGAGVSILVLALTARFAWRLPITFLGRVAFALMFVGGVIGGLAYESWMFIVGVAMVLGFDGLFNVYIRTRRMEIIPRKDYGKVMGLLMIANNLSKPMSGLIIFVFTPGVPVLTLLLILTLMAGILTGVLGLLRTDGPTAQTTAPDLELEK